MKRAIVNCQLVDVSSGDIQDSTTILWENETIQAIGKNLDLPADVEVIDGEGRYVTPGLINAYTHLGLKEVGIRWEGNDAYEPSEASYPHLSVVDGIYPFDKGFEYARAAGVTTAHVSPGPENVIAGQTAIIKTSGTVVDQMIVDKHHGLAVSLGDIPKKAYFNKHKSPITRMGIASLIRKQLNNSRYQVDDDDQTSEIFKRVLDKELPLYIRAHRMDDIVTAVRLKEEFNINIVIVHGTEAFKIKTLLKKFDVPVLAGPFYSSKLRPEMGDLHPSSVARLHEAKLSYAISTPTVRNLALEGALAEREGLRREDALHALTLGAANILGISHKLGSIERGKQADLVLWDGKPLELKTSVQQTICDGVTVYHKEGGSK